MVEGSVFSIGCCCCCVRPVGVVYIIHRTHPTHPTHPHKAPTRARAAVNQRVEGAVRRGDPPLGHHHPQEAEGPVQVPAQGVGLDEHGVRHHVGREAGGLLFRGKGGGGARDLWC